MFNLDLQKDPDTVNHNIFSQKLENDLKTLKSESKDINLEPYLNQSDFQSINSLNRSIVINNKYIGPDINFLIPPGFAWNERYKFDFSVRGHNRRKDGDYNLRFF